MRALTYYTRHTITEYCAIVQLSIEIKRKRRKRYERDKFNGESQTEKNRTDVFE